MMESAEFTDPISTEKDTGSKFGTPMTEAAKASSAYTNKIPFYLLILYLAFEYGRVHILLGPLKSLHLPFLASMGLLLFLIAEKPVLKDKQTKWFLGLVILMAIQVPFALNNHWAFLYTRMVFTYLIIHLGITKYVVSYGMFRKMMFLWLMCGIFLCIQGVLHGGEVKGTAFFSDNNDFSLAMNIFLGISFFRFVENPKKNMGVLAIIALFLCGILVSFSRGGFVGLCVMGVFILAKARRKMLGVLLVIAMILFVSQIAPSKYWDRMRTITDVQDDRGTARGRIYYWQRAWEMFLDHPLVGVGPGNFNWNISEYEPEEGLRGKTRGGRASHSLYFTLIPELGLVGCFLFGMMLFVNYRTLRRVMKQFKGRERTQASHERVESEGNRALKGEDSETSQIMNMMYYDALGIYVAFAGFLVSGMFVSVLYYPHFWILSSMASSLGRLQEELEKKKLAFEEHRFGLAK